MRDTRIWRNRLLYALVAFDIVFILLHVVYRFSDLIGDRRFSIERERGYSEYYQYLKEFGILMMLIGLAVRQRAPVFFSWSLLFLYLLLDDSLALHETWGKVVADTFGFPELLGLRSRDLGELVISGMAGLTLFLAIFVTHRLSDKRARLLSGLLLRLLLALVFFGVVIDTGHAMIEPIFWKRLAGILEDGGELIIMSIGVWFLAGKIWQPEHIPAQFVAPSFRLSALQTAPQKSVDNLKG